jgi:hypothetical protein
MGLVEIGRRDDLYAEASLWSIAFLPHLTVSASVQVPVYEHFDGAQLPESLRAMAMLTYDDWHR